MTPERLIASIAGGQNGVVARRQLLDAGLTERQIDHRLARGDLARALPGIYRAGHSAPSLEARYMAGVLACGDGALLHGLAAAHLWGIVKGRPPRPAVVAPRQRNVAGVITRTCRGLDLLDGTMLRAIPITTLPRTVVDLAGLLSEDDLARACHEAQVRHRLTPPAVEAVLARNPRPKGVAALRRVLYGDARVTLSELERLFLALLRAEGLPLPITNRPAGGRRVDCRFVEHRLTVELDSYAFHHTRHAWEQDHLRTRAAYARGDEIRRYTWRDVVESPAQMLRELRLLLLGDR